MQDSQRRRFIAGAVCPQCGVLDRIVVDQEADRLLEKHAQALALELVSPENDPSREVSVADALKDHPQILASSMAFTLQERWAQHREERAPTVRRTG